MNLNLYVDSNFEGLGADDLRKIAKSAGIKVPPNAGEDWIKRAIVAKASGSPPPAEEVMASAPSGDVFKDMPNLTAFGKWGGRRHSVILANNSGDATKKGEVVHWQGIPWALPYGKQIDLGEPWYNVLRTSVTTLNNGIREFNDENNVRRVELIEQDVPTFAFTYLGVTKGTEDLPGSLLEFYRDLAKRKNNFAKFNRRGLIRVLTDLRNDIGDEKIRQMSDEDLREKILSWLGPEFADAGNFDRYEDEAA